MVGGVFYEHGHRMVAATVGFLTLILTVWIVRQEKRKWVKVLSISALCAVILQGLLGGITVLLLLPKPVSIMHAVLAQTFFVLTILIAYSQSVERQKREYQKIDFTFLKYAFFLAILVYLQLILGATMRHTDSGLAIPDFPKMGGYVLPPFNDEMLYMINNRRFDMNLPPVTLVQIVIHFMHRAFGFVIFIFTLIIGFVGLRYCAKDKKIMQAVYFLAILVMFQISLGASTVLTQRQPVITSLHVVMGAALLGVCVLLFLRASPLRLKDLINEKG
jgi:cytochrome c oxidase assembly protein subunit 15